MLNMNNNKESGRRGGGENATSYVHTKLTKTIVASDTDKDTAAERDTDTEREIRMLMELGTCMKQEQGVRGA